MIESAPIDDYIAKLKAHDWTYEYSDDHDVWRRGIEEHQHLNREQLKYDPRAAIWNEHCHPMMRKVTP